MLQEEAKTNRSTPRRASELCQAHGRLVIDGVRQRLVELADRIVRQRGEMDDSVESIEVPLLHVAHVDPQTPAAAVPCPDRSPRTEPCRDRPRRDPLPRARCERPRRRSRCFRSGERAWTHPSAGDSKWEPLVSRSVNRRGRAARSRCGRRGPSRSRARRRDRPCVPRSERSRGRAPGRGSGS